jgi:putative IMPACT (imprinted ancient) family translation regulator
MSTQTLAQPAQFVLEAKKSRFLAHAAPVESAAAALEWIRAGADPDATHNCWAYRLGAEYRFSDDGEPGGSAGRPIVTRWYGGTNLGVGGLARAYGGAAAECLRTAPKVALVTRVEAELTCDFALAAAVHGLLPALGAEKLGESFETRGVRLRLRLPASSFEALADRLRDLSRGNARLRLQDAPAE